MSKQEVIKHLTEKGYNCDLPKDGIPVIYVKNKKLSDTAEAVSTLFHNIGYDQSFAARYISGDDLMTDRRNYWRLNMDIGVVLFPVKKRSELTGTITDISEESIGINISKECIMNIPILIIAVGHGSRGACASDQEPAGNSKHQDQRTGDPERDQHPPYDLFFHIYVLPQTYFFIAS